MEYTDDDMLRDLALLYVALAHDTDDDLSDVEVKAMAERLYTWQDVSREAVMTAVRSALQDYVSEDAPDRIQEAMGRLRDELPEDLRRSVLDDLLEIAMADDRFLYEESAFIGDLAQAWGLHPTARPEAATHSWSLLTPEAAGAWTPVHDLALIYLTLAHETDETLSDREIEAITRKLGEWIPDADEQQVLDVVKSALGVYVQGPDRRVFTDAVEAVRQHLPEHQRAALLADLHYIAQADGAVLGPEQQLINQLREAWRMTAA